ncbi:Uncharacterised protein [uncultured archaeon]|nr:Uncharacterised protein [uncultured archaeon]
MNKTFIFDLDDTLIYTHFLYSRAKADLARLVDSRFGYVAPDVLAILRLHEEVDLRLTKEMGFSRERFPTSLSEAYTRISEMMGEPERERKQNAQEAYNLGKTVFDKGRWLPSLVPGALETLDFLTRQRDELAIVTIGEEFTQNEKVKFYELNRWFGDRVYIVPNHKKERIKELAEDRDPKRVWFAGNSARSDILPALEVGIGALYVPRETWAHDQCDLKGVDTSRLITLKSIKEIPEIYSTKLS